MPFNNLKNNDDLRKTLKKVLRDEEEAVAKRVAEELNLAYINLSIVPIDPEAVVVLSKQESLKAQLAIIEKTGHELRVAAKNPSFVVTQKILAELKEKGFKLHIFVVSLSSLRKAWEIYDAIKPVKETRAGEMKLEQKIFDEFEQKVKDIHELKNRINELSPSEVLGIIMAGAIKTKTSDIHLEPGKESVRLRYRVDGSLQDISEFSKDGYHYMLSRIKVLSDMRINVSDEPQDGRFRVVMDSGAVDIRVSILPSGQGETIVMRLLSSNVQKLKIEDLGINKFVLEKINIELEKTGGMILTTGPTGSGKTTTLYTFLNKINSSDVKIITVEDPIEYELPGINQTPVNKRRGLSFGQALRSIVRQDPDVVMVGEIRDFETADIAINAALTGHLVFSTLHTNDAIGIIARFMEIGVELALIPQAVNVYMAQRLARRLCTHCREQVEPTFEQVEFIQKVLAIISPKAKADIPKDINKIYKAKGCDKCFGLGYKGRIGMYEILFKNEKIEKLILDKAPPSQILETAIEEGMITMLQDGILKVLGGITSYEEVKRVLGEAPYVEELYEKSLSSLLSRGIRADKKDLEVVEKIINQEHGLEHKIKQSEVKETLKLICLGGVIKEATDIHIEPGEQSFRVRYRIDEMLQDYAVLPKGIYPNLVAEIKLFSGLKLNVHEKTQDGRFSIFLSDTTIDTRVSVIPGGYGETVVIRLLKAGIESLKLNDLGIRKELLIKIEQELKKPNGLVLATGPTGSGKTTTLYAMLNKLNQPGVKIITIEDPIEYKLAGILQTQVNQEKGYSFAQALRALLRQNPNIVMVGEIRDEETAATALQASLTGHLLLSTLHTNDASSAFSRLEGLGIKRDDIAASANVIIAQRLVRKLCQKCRVKYAPTAEAKNLIKKELSSKTPKKINLYKAKGCKICNNSGYKGITGLYEIIIVNEAIREAILKELNVDKIRQIALANGMLTLMRDGVEKMLEGITSWEEVKRVIG